MTKSSTPWYPVLDGWRGISILCVLASHMLPLGPKSWQLNEASALLGMTIVFTLSGFLITTTLVNNSNIASFLIRRFCRIIPLAWAFCLVALPLMGAGFDVYLAHFLFYINLPPFWVTNLTGHYWSLGVEAQFYIGVALLVLLLKQRGLLLLPVLCLIVTGLRIWHGQTHSIVTYYRVDEILVGASLALVHFGRLGKFIPQLLSRLNPFFLIPILLISTHAAGGPVNYLRPYLTFLVVGATLYQEKHHLSRWLLNQKLAYVASISYALYIIHPLTYYGWLGSGDTLIKYAKRVLSLILTFTFAHFSTSYFEKPFIALGKKWSNAVSGR